MMLCSYKYGRCTRILSLEKKSKVQLNVSCKDAKGSEAAHRIIDYFLPHLQTVLARILQVIYVNVDVAFSYSCLS